MQVAEFDHNDFSRPRAGDERLAVRFFVKAKQDPDLTAEAGGIPKFREHEYIQIMVPGDRNNIIARPLTDRDKDRFARQYEHWKKTQTNELVTGTPLEAWGILNLAQIEEYRYFGVRTIEQLGNLNDDICQKITGAVGLKQRAQTFLAMAKDEAPMKRVQAELDKRDNQIATLTAAVEEQSRLLHDYAKRLGLATTPLAPAAEVSAPKPAKKKAAPKKPKAAVYPAPAG